jgi:predicted Rdx family selenoprotein
MFTLLKCISGGLSWHDAVTPLGQVSPYLTSLFIIFVRDTAVPERGKQEGLTSKADRKRDTAVPERGKKADRQRDTAAPERGKRKGLTGKEEKARKGQKQEPERG